MMLLSNIKKILLCLIIMMFICTPQRLCFAEEHTLRVGYVGYHGFIVERKDGSYYGYGAEYLAKIAEYTGWHYEYVEDDWKNLLQMLAEKKIDLLCMAQRTEDRAAAYDYSQFPIGYTQGLLYTRKDCQWLCYEDFQMFGRLKVGIVRDSAMKRLFADYEKHGGFSSRTEEYDSDREMMRALDSGRIDAVCSDSMAGHRDLTLLGRFGADAYYITSWKGSPWMKAVNSALRMIKADPYFEAGLSAKYYGDRSNGAIRFTRAERDYIVKTGPIRVGLSPIRNAFSLYDPTSRRFTGICVDVLNEISRTSGLNFELVPFIPSKTTPELLATGKYDIICGVERDNFAANTSISATRAFLSSSIVPAGFADKKTDINSRLKVSMPVSFQALYRHLTEMYPNFTLIRCATNREALDLVAKGDADLFIQNTHMLAQLLQEPRYQGISMLPIEIMKEHTAIAVPTSLPPELISVLNKSIEGLDKSVVTSSIIRHTFATPYKYTAADMVGKYKVQIAIIGALVLACFGLLWRLAAARRHNELSLQKKNDELAEAVAQADKANSAKSLFLSRMSHEIRTPMNAIVGLTAIAKQHETDPAAMDDYLSKIETSSRVLLNIINDVLDMSAIESSKLKIANSDFDIKQVLTGISTIYYPQCRNKGVRFEMGTDIENEHLIGDSLRMSQILLNLVSNAYKFTPSGGCISVMTKETARRDRTAFLRFKVSDTGCGMSEDMLARIFKPFEQESGTTAREHGGSGLGLSIAKNLVDMMHGAISVESKKDAGTTFTVDLPFVISERGGDRGRDTLKSVRLIVADDDESAREYSSIVLKRLGVNFDLASSGREALNMIETAERSDSPYNVCLIDWKMPDMDGVEVARRIRETERQRTLIIIISAYDLKEVEQEAKIAGADHFITKPLFQSTIYNVLMSLTNGAIQPEHTEPTGFDFTGRRVLLAEDQDLNAEIAIELLGVVNLEADRAENGRAAVEMFEKSAPGTYGAILMDVQMPLLDGYGATRAIRALDRPDAKSVPIFAMTANAFTEDVSAAISAGMNGHLSKPIETQTLYATLAKAMNHVAKN